MKIVIYLQLLERGIKIPKLKIGHKVQLGQSGGLVNPSKSTIKNEEYKKKQHQQVQIANHQNQNYGSSSSYVELGNGIIALPDISLTTEESIHVASLQPLDQNTVN